MSHRIYTTEGWVVESRPYGEAGRMLSIFTRELGMINAAAQGVRLGQSKLRYHTQDFSLAEFSLVRGRDLWRLVGAEKNTKMGQKSAEDTVKDTAKNPEPLFIRTLAIVRRLVHGEEKNEALFETILSVYDFFNTSLNQGEATNEKSASVILPALAEPIIMLRILHHLGYIRKKPELEVFLTDDSFDRELLEKMSVPGVTSSAVKEINKALEQSHL